MYDNVFAGAKCPHPVPGILFAVDDMTRLSVGELESSTATDFRFWIVVLLQLEAWK